MDSQELGASLEFTPDEITALIAAIEYVGADRCPKALHQLRSRLIHAQVRIEERQQLLDDLS